MFVSQQFKVSVKQIFALISGKTDGGCETTKGKWRIVQLSGFISVWRCLQGPFLLHVGAYYPIGIFWIAVVERSNASRKYLEAMRFWSISAAFGLLNRHDCAHSSLENKISFKWLISFIFRLLIQPSPTLLVGKDWSGNKKKGAFGPESSLRCLFGLHSFISSGHGGRLCQVLNPICD